MKSVALVQPPSEQDASHGDLNMPPMSLAYLADKLSPEYAVKIFDGRRLGMHRLTEELKQFNPDIVGISVWCTNQQFGNTLAKSTDRPVIMGGPNVSSCVMASRVLNNNPNVLAVLRGPAEFSFRKLCDRLIVNHRIDDIPGLTFRKSRTIFHNPMPPPPDNLDFRAGVNIRKYFPAITYNFRPQTTSYTNMPQVPSAFFDGCTKASLLGKCSFCSVRLSRPVTMTPKVVAKELATWRDQGVEYVMESGSSLDPQWVKELARFGDQYDFLKIRAYTQSDNMTNDFARDLRRCNVWGVVMGIESADQAILKTVGKPYDLERVEASIRALGDQGVKVITSYILGLPGETPQTLQATVDLSRRLFEKYTNIMRVFYNVFTLEPNSTLFNLAVKNEEFVVRYNQTAHANLKTDDVFDYVALDATYFQHYTGVSLLDAQRAVAEAKKINALRSMK